MTTISKELLLGSKAIVNNIILNTYNEYKSGAITKSWDLVAMDRIKETTGISICRRESIRRRRSQLASGKATYIYASKFKGKQRTRFGKHEAQVAFYKLAKEVIPGSIECISLAANQVLFIAKQLSPKLKALITCEESSETYQEQKNLIKNFGKKAFPDVEFLTLNRNIHDVMNNLHNPESYNFYSGYINVFELDLCNVIGSTYDRAANNLIDLFGEVLEASRFVNKYSPLVVQLTTVVGFKNISIEQYKEYNVPNMIKTIGGMFGYDIDCKETHEYSSSKNGGAGRVFVETFVVNKNKGENNVKEDH